MQTLKIPTFWTAEQADSIYQFVGELQAAIWQQYHQEIEALYEKIRVEQTLMESADEFDDEIEF